MSDTPGHESQLSAPDEYTLMGSPGTDELKAANPTAYLFYRTSGREPEPGVPFDRRYVAWVAAVLGLENLSA